MVESSEQEHEESIEALEEEKARLQKEQEALVENLREIESFIGELASENEQEELEETIYQL